MTSNDRYKLKKTTDAVLKTPTDGTLSDSPTRGQSEPAKLWAKLTEAQQTPQSRTGWKWKAVYHDPSMAFDATGKCFKEFSPSIDSGDDFTAFEVNNAPAQKNQYVQLSFFGYNAQQKPVYLFTIGGAGVANIYVSSQNAGPGNYKGFIVHPNPSIDENTAGTNARANEMLTDEVILLNQSFADVGSHSMMGGEVVQATYWTTSTSGKPVYLFTGFGITTCANSDPENDPDYEDVTGDTGGA